VATLIGHHLAEVTRYELGLLDAAVNSIGVDETAGEALHLRTLADGRQWVVEAATGQLVIDVVDDSNGGDDDDSNDDDSNDDDGEHDEVSVAISERVRRFGDCFADDTLTLSIADDHTILAVAGSTTAAIDVVAREGAAPYPVMVVPMATLAVPMRQFQLLLWAARCLPSGIQEVNYPVPPMWLQFGDGWLGLHVDWTDFVPSRATYRIPTIMGVGRTTTAIPHALIESFLQGVPTADDGQDPELSITVGTVSEHRVTRDAILFEADSWRLVLWLTDPMEARWAATVNHQLAAAGIEVLDTDSVEWIVKSNGFEVRVKLHHGHPDVARVSAVLVGSADESIELLRELGQLNSSSTRVRYWLADDVVRAAVDLPCTTLTTIAEVVHLLGESAARYSPMLAALCSTA